MNSSCREVAMCDVCTQPINISSPFYICQQLGSDDCDFLAHVLCASNLPTSVELSVAGILSKAVLGNSEEMQVFFSSIFPCGYCHRPSNGYCYYFLDGGGNMSIPFDIECAAAPKTIKHASHMQHILFRTFLIWSGTPLKCCSSESIGFDVYRCVFCEFYIHIRCALLPKRTCHKFDEHPLKLMFTDHDPREDAEECFCEYCEQHINRQYWYYGCPKCDQYFHINCIPSVGYLSKVKFGKTLVDHDIHPDHPLALTRMLDVGRNERCGACNEVIKASVAEEMAFHCRPCDFWIHFSCAKDSSPTSGPSYSQFLGFVQHLMRFAQAYMEQRFINEMT